MGKVLNMDDEKLHFSHIMRCEFRKSVSVEIATKNIQKIYFDRDLALPTSKTSLTKVSS